MNAVGVEGAGVAAALGGGLAAGGLIGGLSSVPLGVGGTGTTAYLLSRRRLLLLLLLLTAALGSTTGSCRLDGVDFAAEAAANLGSLESWVARTCELSEIHRARPSTGVIAELGTASWLATSTGAAVSIAGAGKGDGRLALAVANKVQACLNRLGKLLGQAQSSCEGRKGQSSRMYSWDDGEELTREESRDESTDANHFDERCW